MDTAVSCKVAILGSGPAGYTAAIYAGRAAFETVLVEGMQPGGQLMLTHEIENFPGFDEKIPTTELMQNMKRQAERFGAKILSGEATAVDFGSRPFKIFLDDNRIVAAQAVIIATGASARYLGLESERRLLGRGVSACAVCDGAFYRNLPVAVVGGGDSALEEALFLTRFASKVSIIHRRDRFRAAPLLAERVKTHPKIETVWNSVVEEVLDVAKQEVTGVRLKNVNTGEHSTLEIAGLFVAIGHNPNTDIFKGQLELDAAGYILTENTRTSIPGVFAAGDVQDPRYRQAITAAASGCMAALEAEKFLGE